MKIKEKVNRLGGCSSKLTVVIILLIISFIGGFYIGAGQSGSNNSASVGLFKGEGETKPEKVDMTPFWKTWRVLNKKYVPVSTSTEVTTQDKIWGSIQGLTNSLKDPHTIFLPPSDNKVFKEDISGNFEGVGMRIGIRDGVLTVISPLEGTPAKRSGILSGDKIIKINGESTQNMGVEKAVKKIRGKKGTEVVLTVKREDVSEPIEISITRDEIKIPTIDTNLRKDGVFVIKFFSFNEASAHRFRKALRKFVKTDSHELIIDLRGNPGGYLQAAVETASWFLPMGKVVVKESGQNSEPKVYRSKGYDIFNKNLELAILVNKGTASASEIFAGALRDHGKATLIGGKTFGKGSVQELVQITPKTSLKVTVARWLTPEGKSISGNGLKPDIKVPMDREAKEKNKDPQLQRAVEFLKEK